MPSRGEPVESDVVQWNFSQCLAFNHLIINISFILMKWIWDTIQKSYFVFFSHLCVYYTPHFHFNVVNYNCDCKEVYIIVIPFPPEADGPKKCIVRLHLDFFGQHSLLEENTQDVIAVRFSETKDLWLFLRQDLQVEFVSNNKTNKSEVILPYTLQTTPQEKIYSML